jgi:hypothetical protein
MSDYGSMLPFIHGLGECLPAGSADGSLLFMILNVYLNIMTMTFPIPRVPALFLTEHIILSLVVVLVVRSGGGGEEDLSSKRAKNLVDVSFPSSPDQRDAVMLFSA